MDYAAAKEGWVTVDPSSPIFDGGDVEECSSPLVTAQLQANPLSQVFSPRRTCHSSAADVRSPRILDVGRLEANRAGPWYSRNKEFMIGFVYRADSSSQRKDRSSRTKAP